MDCVRTEWILYYQDDDYYTLRDSLSGRTVNLRETKIAI